MMQSQPFFCAKQSQTLCKSNNNLTDCLSRCFHCKGLPVKQLLTLFWDYVVQQMTHYNLSIIVVLIFNSWTEVVSAVSLFYLIFMLAVNCGGWIVPQEDVFSVFFCKFLIVIEYLIAIFKDRSHDKVCI